MTLEELANEHKIKAIYIIGKDGDATTVEWNDATREKFGHVQVHRIGLGLYESPWQQRQYPQDTIAYGVVVALA